MNGESVAIPPPTTMLGGLLRYLREADPKHFQPMNANFGLVEPLPDGAPKSERRAKLVERAERDFAAWRTTL